MAYALNIQSTNVTETLALFGYERNCPPCLSDDSDESFNELYHTIKLFLRQSNKILICTKTNLLFLAVKCNYSKIVLETLAACGSGFDCASKDEIQKTLSLGVSPDKIIFAHPTKKISHIVFAREHNITNLTFDCENELYKIQKYYPEARYLSNYIYFLRQDHG